MRDFLICGLVLVAASLVLAGCRREDPPNIHTRANPAPFVEFGIIEISNIAVKALSPSIDDPTTALRGIDRLGEILRRLGTRNPPAVERTVDGRVHFIARYTRFERAVALSFDQIRHYGATNAAVAIHLLSTLERLGELLPAERVPPLATQARAVLRDARSSIGNPTDLEAVERAAEQALGVSYAAAGPWARGAVPRAYQWCGARHVRNAGTEPAPPGGAVRRQEVTGPEPFPRRGCDAHHPRSPPGAGDRSIGRRSAVSR